MHIPNGYLTDPVCAITTLSAAAALGVGVVRARRLDTPAALMAATGAGLFAGQMVNFPIDAGTSGHVLGAALAAIVLGPWRGMLTVAMVLAVQCVLFGDGGVSTLGANILNMAVAGTLVAWALNSSVTRLVSGTRGKLAGAAVAAVGSVLASAALCSVELAASGTHSLADVFAAMMGIHAVIAGGEALATVAIVAILLTAAARKQQLSPAWTTVTAIAVAGLLAPIASTVPDGLEHVAQELNFANLAQEGLGVIAPDYALPGVAWPYLAIALAGIAGVAFVFVTTYTVSRAALVKVRKR